MKLTGGDPCSRDNPNSKDDPNLGDNPCARDDPSPTPQKKRGINVYLNIAIELQCRYIDIHLQVQGEKKVTRPQPTQVH